MAQPPSNRLRPCVAAKIIFYPVSKLPPGSPQMLPCSCSLPPSPKKGGKARFQPWLRPYMAAKVIFYRVSKLPPGSPQMLPCSCSLPPSPQKGQPPSNGLRPGVAAKLIFLIRFRNCRRAALKCLRAAAACRQAPRRVAQPPSNRLRPCVAAKIIFYPVSKLPPGSPRMLPCSCSLPPSAPRRVAKPGFSLVLPPQSFFPR